MAFQVWVAEKVKKKNGEEYAKTSKTFPTAEEAAEYIRTARLYRAMMGYDESESADADTQLVFTKGDESVEYYVYTTDGFEQAPEIVVNTYGYDGNVYLEVMHDFGNKIAAVYAYNPKFAAQKVCLLRTGIEETDISDSELLAFVMEDLESQLDKARSLFWTTE